MNGSKELCHRNMFWNLRVYDSFGMISAISKLPNTELGIIDISISMLAIYVVLLGTRLRER